MGKAEVWFWTSVHLGQSSDHPPSLPSSDFSFACLADVTVTDAPQFGLGALAASWYYKHQEHKRRHERAVAYPTTGPNTYSNNPPEPSYASGHWKHEWSWPASGQSPTPPQYKPFTPPTPHTPPTQAAVPQTEAQIKSAILAELQNSTHDAEPEAQPAEERSRRWGWGGRHRRHREEQFTPAVAEVNVNATGRNTETSQEEMRKLRAAVETIWEEKKSSAVRTQETVNEQVSQGWFVSHAFY